MPKILILGPSGAGKTHVSSYLRTTGINAVDADEVPGLSGWFDGFGKKVECPPDADEVFLNNHQFLWNRDFLKQYLQNQNNIYLFGMAGNAFDMIGLFDRAYFLKASPEMLAERLRHESRENPMGKTEYQLQNALNWAKEIEDKAKERGVTMIDADQNPDEIFKEITEV
jgi:shikimate kinase